MKKPDGNYLSVREYSEKYGVAKDTIWHWINREKIECVKFNNHWFIPAEALPNPNANRHRAFKAEKIALQAWSGEEIRKARLSLKIGQKELAEISGVYWITISRIERECFKKSKANTALLLTLVLKEIKRNKIYKSLSEKELNTLGYARRGS